MNTFNAIDVETANADRASICQIGIVCVEDGKIVDEWQSLIDPEDWFDPWNISIHGIEESHVRGSPTMPKVRAELRRRLRGSILVSHTAFDRTALERAMNRYDLEQLQVTWLDSAKIARRAWPDKYGTKGYGLRNVAYDLGISFRHHDALEDARAAAQVALCACNDTGLTIKEWLLRVRGPVFDSVRDYQPQQWAYASVKRSGNVEGNLYGESIVFTGRLGMSKREAADLAAAAGCNVMVGVGKKTTLLVVGVQNRKALRGYDKSTKHRKAEKLISEGFGIQIICEEDFLDLIDAQ